MSTQVERQRAEARAKREDLAILQVNLRQALALQRNNLLTV